MPAPTAPQLESPVNGFFQGAGLRGEDASGLSKTVAQSTAQAMTMLLSMGMVMLGIPAAVDPISGSGSTAGPGMLMPPPAGGPNAQQLEGIVKGQLSGQGIRGEDAGNLGKAIAATIAQAVMLFTSQTKVLPGMAVAGFVTTSPGKMLPVPLQGQLQGLANGFLQQNGIRGEYAADLAKALAQSIDMGFNLFAAQVMVSPGIACPPGASAAPGKFM